MGGSKELERFLLQMKQLEKNVPKIINVCIQRGRENSV